MLNYLKPYLLCYFLKALKNKRSWVISVCFFISNWLYAQNSESHFSVYDLYFKNPSVINPSEVDTRKTFAGYLGNRSLTGAFAGVHRTFADLTLLTNQINSPHKIKHFIGAQVLNNRDGAYFQRNRLYIRYSLSLPLSKKIKLQSGASFGIVNYAFQNSNSGSGGSDYTPDANLGISLQHENYSIGISGQQLSSSSIKPVEYTYQLDPFLIISGAVGKDLSPFIRLNAYSVIEISPSTDNLQYQITSTLMYQDVLEAGGGYNQQKGVFILAGIPQLQLNQWYLNVNVSYLVYNPKNVSNLIDRSVEVSLGIVLPR